MLVWEKIIGVLNNKVDNFLHNIFEFIFQGLGM